MDVNLTVNGAPLTKIRAKLWERMFSDNSYTIQDISKPLLGADLYQLSWTDEKYSSIYVSSGKDAAIIVAIWEHEERQGVLMNLLQADGWTLKNDLQIRWKAPWNEFGKTKSILSRPLKAGRFLSFSIPENNLPASILVIEGRIKCFVL